MHPGARLLVAGPGDAADLLKAADPRAAAATEVLGMVSDADKASLLRSVDAYVAPHLGGESFGIVLVEAMAAGRPGRGLRPAGLRRRARRGPHRAAVRDRVARGAVAGHVLDLARRPRAPRRAAGRRAGAGRRVFDWGVVADRIMAVYETVIAGADARAGRPRAAGPVGPPRARRAGRRQLMGTVDVLQLATFIVILVIGIAWYLSYSAARLDRLHAKVEGAMSALDAALVRRAEAALELANSGVLDPASALLIADAATESIERTTEQPVTGDLLDGQHFGGREQVESDLSEALRAALTGEVVRRPARRATRTSSPTPSTGSRRAACGCSWPGGSTTTPPARCAGCAAKRSVRLFRLCGLRRAARAGQLRRRAAPGAGRAERRSRGDLGPWFGAGRAPTYTVRHE